MAKFPDCKSNSIVTVLSANPIMLWEKGTNSDSVIDHRMSNKEMRGIFTNVGAV